MNKKKPSVVGIDISMLTFNARINGVDKAYPNSRKGWRDFARDSPANAVFVMEATGHYHFRLASFLHSRRKAVYVCNPLYVKNYVRSLGCAVHTDKHDPVNIAKYFEANGGELRRWEPAPAGLGRARMILSLIANLQRQKVMCKNIRHALSFTGESKDLLSVPECLSGQLGDQIDDLSSELFGIVGKMFPREYACLVSIPGIGSLTAAALLAVASGMKSFSGHKQLSKFVGLIPSVRQSGISVSGRGRITKQGNSYLRSLLYLCAMTAVVHNPLLRGFYEGLKLRGKPSNVALVAVAHRLVRIAYGVVKSGELYRGTGREAGGPA
jgi:transposase